MQEKWSEVREREESGTGHFGARDRVRRTIKDVTCKQIKPRVCK